MNEIHTKKSLIAETVGRSSMTPLWVIFGFVSLCEVVAGLAVIQAEGNAQLILTAFVVIFPLLVAAAFFIILWKKPYVFYPPTEFGADTKVAEYVQAFSGLSSIRAEESQKELIGVSNEPPNHSDRASNARNELADKVFKFFSFRRMRYTDVSIDQISRAIFNLGAHHQFNLFDGASQITFFGFFFDVEPVEIVARVRMLLNNVALAYHRADEQPDAALQDQLRHILDQIRIELLIPNEAHADEIKSKIDEFYPDELHVSIEIYTESEVEERVGREYDAMRIAKSGLISQANSVT